jgi:hypothetical protein
MNERTLRALALAFAGVSFFLVGTTLVLIWLGRDAALGIEQFNEADSRFVYTLGALPGVVVGLVIALKMPRNLYGWVWLVLGFGLCLENFCIAYATQGSLIAPGSLPWAAETVALGGLGWVLAVGMLPFVILFFPTGALPSRRWRPVAWIILAALTLSLAMGWALPGTAGIVPIENPFGAQGQVGEIVSLLVNVAVFILIGAVFLSVLSVVVRYRRSKGVERQQLKWFAFGAVLLGISLLSDFFYTAPGVWEALKEQLFFLILPVTIGIAILRYQLFDIDIIIRKTLTYSIVVALLLFVYFGSVILLQRIVAGIIGNNSEIVTVISTLIIAALFVPLRNRIQDVIDKRFYRKKYDAQQVLQKFSETVRDETDLEKLTNELVNVVQETMQPTNVSVWLKRTTQDPSASSGQIRRQTTERVQ